MSALIAEDHNADLAIVDSNFMAMPFRVVLVSLAIFFVARGLVRAVAEGLVFRKAAHANPDRFLLRHDLKRPLVRLNDFAHPPN
jgi:uncharacterized membrane protein AbrB (regulator of aidB expression)